MIGYYSRTDLPSKLGNRRNLSTKIVRDTHMYMNYHDRNVNIIWTHIVLSEDILQCVTWCTINPEEESRNLRQPDQFHLVLYPNGVAGKNDTGGNHTAVCLVRTK